jgi:hypothetical protein
MDKSDEEIIASFSQKQNDCIYLESEKDTTMTPIDSVVITSPSCRINGYGTGNQNIKAWVGGINYKYSIRPRRTRTETNGIL